MKRILLLFIIFHTSLAALFAQVRVTVQAPSQVEEGRNVRVSYIVNTTDVDDIQVGDFPGFELLYGPSTSTQRNVSIVNGKVSNSSQVMFTYTLQARKPGTYK
ncbi:MAG: BatD family protein, partial [Bacteroidaceae bacterium]|nr:BatD family protein [Bacteroidaceae bacterium]